MNADLMDYAGMTQTALRGVIRQAVARAASPKGLPGDHHFFITYLTRAPGVSIPKDLLARYPHEITIVLQHQYQDLRVTDDVFRVTLTFGGFPKALTVPFDAVTRFHDPHAQFTLAFEADEDDLVQDDEPVDEAETVVELMPDPAPKAGKRTEAKADAKASDSEAPSDAPKIVSLDQFRKK